MANTNSKNPITNFAKLLAQGWNVHVKEYADGSRRITHETADKLLTQGWTVRVKEYANSKNRKPILMRR